VLFVTAFWVAALYSFLAPKNIQLGNLTSQSLDTIDASVFVHHAELDFQVGGLAILRSYYLCGT